MPTLTPERSARIARAAVFTVFGLNGFMLAMWVVHIPRITDRTGVDPAALGTFILLMAGAGIVGMRVAGPLADRFGSRVLVGAASVICSLAVLGPGLATGPVLLAIALCCFGFGNGALDVSMNAQAVHVERAYRRPIMSAFHALFSGGGLLGSLLGAATLRADWDIRLTLTLAAAVGVALTLVLAPRLLRDTDVESAGTPAVSEDPESGHHGTPTEHTVDRTTRVRQDAAPTRISHRTRTILALAAIAFGVLLAEGVAGDWSTLHLREHLGADDATAALAFGAFSVTMTAGRFTADRFSAAFGRVAVVRYGSAVAALGFALIVVSPWIPLTLFGWAAAGLGLSGVVPQIFTAAGNLGTGSAASDMAKVFGLGYFGLLAGPAIIGWLTVLVPLTVALLVPLAAVLLCCWQAKVVAPR